MDRRVTFYWVRQESEKVLYFLVHRNGVIEMEIDTRSLDRRLYAILDGDGLRFRHREWCYILNWMNDVHLYQQSWEEGSEVAARTRDEVHWELARFQFGISEREE